AFSMSRRISASRLRRPHSKMDSAGLPDFPKDTELCIDGRASVRPLCFRKVGVLEWTWQV
ncbi:MAG TPA: hypothetical protein PLZ55_18485, partial [bacterium]|nr:hypothetical protein [bacterium]